MKIERIDVYHVRMPLHTPFRTAYGEDDVIESVLVRLMSDGHEGWGESCPLGRPTYSPEWAGGVHATVAQHLAPQIVGRDIADADALQQVMSPIKGNPFAKAALDMAWWDLEAKRCGRPLWQQLGGTGDTVTVGADFGVADSTDALIEQIAAALEAGFARIKLKYRRGWDLPMVAAVRSAFPQAVIHIDCNAGYSLEDTPMFEALDRYELAMIEQPLEAGDLHDHAALARRIRTPICLDESIHCVRAARQAIELGACGWLNLKPGRVGGHTPARAIHDLARRAGIGCWVGGMLESALGASHCLALATLANCRAYPCDIFPSDRFYDDDLAEPPMTLAGPSQVRASNSPGCGRTPHCDRLTARTVRHAQFTANAPAAVTYTGSISN